LGIHESEAGDGWQGGGVAMFCVAYGGCLRRWVFYVYLVRGWDSCLGGVCWCVGVGGWCVGGGVSMGFGVWCFAGVGNGVWIWWVGSSEAGALEWGYREGVWVGLKVMVWGIKGGLDGGGGEGDYAGVRMGELECMVLESGGVMGGGGWSVVGWGGGGCWCVFWGDQK